VLFVEQSAPTRSLPPQIDGERTKVIITDAFRAYGWNEPAAKACRPKDNPGIDQVDHAGIMRRIKRSQAKRRKQQAFHRGRFIRLDGPSGRARHLNLKEILPTGAERARISGANGPEYPEPTP